MHWERFVGNWSGNSGVYLCTRCGYRMPLIHSQFHYIACPRCGSPMTIFPTVTY